MKVTGKVIETKIDKGVSKAGKEWQSKKIVLEWQDGSWTKNLCVELFGESKINDNPVRKGQNVTVDFDIESRKYGDNWYTSVNAWRVRAAEKGANGLSDNNSNPAPISMSTLSQDETSQLPF